MIKILKNNTLGLLGLIIPFSSVTLMGFKSIAGMKIISVYFIVLALTILIVSLCKTQKSYTIAIIISTFLYSIAAFFDITYFITFGSRITLSSIYILLESNLNESKEFISMYLKTKFLFLLGIFLLGIIIGAIISYKQHASFNEFKKLINHNKLYTSVLVIGLLCGFYVFKNNFSLYVATHSSYLFQKERRIISNLKITPNGSFKNVVHTGSKKDKEIYVIIIGESTTSTHMGLYGYYRETTPRLSKRKDDLLLYNNVRSPHTHTIQSLGKTLTLGDYDNPTKMFNSSLIQLINSAGFYTYFISNQAPVGEFETTVTLTSKISDESTYTNTLITKPDSILIKPLEQALKTEIRKKFIILHLMGTHVAYNNRYPEDFNLFNSTPHTNFRHELAYNTINEYDNAVLYNDYIVDKIIDLVCKENAKSYVLYFSDHGEDVYETMNQACHEETAGTEPMFKIPFIIWFSEKYKESPNNLYIDTKRKYNTKDLIYTIADLSSIKFQCFNPQKSIVNHHFKEAIE